MPVTLTVDADGVAHLTLDRASKRNALDRAMIDDLNSRIGEIRSRDDVRLVVLRGAGGTFCAGADIGDWVRPPHHVAAENSRFGKETFAALAALPMASVAVIEGGAIGGGLELALACDLRIASTDALLGLPELGLGNLPSWGGVARLVDIAGVGVTRHLLLSGELITGARAAELLVVTAAHPANTLDAAVDRIAARLLASEPTAVGLAKQLLADLESSLAAESALAGYTATLESSRSRKQDFLDRKAAARATSAGADRHSGATGSTPTPTTAEGTES